MYCCRDKTQAIANLQEMLYEISRDDDNVSTVYVDGIYGDNTEECVKYIQQKNNIEPNGKVDKQTFDIVVKEYDEHRRARGRLAQIEVFPLVPYNAVIQEGEQGARILVIQAMLKSLDYIYKDMDKVEVNGVYDEKTAEAVKRVQKVDNLKVTGQIDRTTWNCLADAFNKFSKKHI